MPRVIGPVFHACMTAATSGTLAAVLVAFGLACVIVLPGLALLYHLDHLPEESVPG